MILKVSKYIVPKGYIGISLYPYVFVRDIKDATPMFIRHELIHIKQQSELLVLFFYIWYCLEFLILLIKYRDRDKAYYNLSFEKEAYYNQEDVDYIKNRKPFNFIKYYGKPNFFNPRTKNPSDRTTGSNSSNSNKRNNKLL